MNFLTRTLSESDGNPSTMRLATLLIVAASMAAWTFTSIKSGVLQPLSSEQVALVLGALAAKGWQRKNESDPAK